VISADLRRYWIDHRFQQYHHALWPEFVKAETGVGGPDCQLKLMSQLLCTRTSDPINIVWGLGCYAAHHCVPSGYVVWQNWRAEQVLDAGVDKMEAWLREHWSALPVRPEMRSHRMPEKRAQCLVDFARYAVQEYWANTNLTYEDVWVDSQKRVKYYGRYMAIKYLELLRMTVRPDLILGDMRARHAWSPRMTLAMLFPENADPLADRENHSEAAIALSEMRAAEVVKLTHDAGVPMSFFQLQVLLCNYREALAGGFYPGAGHDEEMDYIKLCESKFDCSDIWRARQELFPQELLGELNGWHGIRKDRYADWKAKAPR
jgi:hypothetical protein